MSRNIYATFIEAENQVSTLDVTNPHHDDHLRDEVTCPGCHQIAVPPIYNCTNGHIVCAICRPKLSNCVTCCGQFTNIQNLFAENVVKSLEVHCRWAACNKRLQASRMRTHMAECQFRPIHCYETEFQICNGQKIEFQNYLPHLKRVHGIETPAFQQKPIFSFPVKCVGFDPGRTFPTHPFYFDGNECFFFHRTVKNSNISAWVSYFGSEDNARNYHCRITLGPSSGVPQINWHLPVHTVRVNLDQLEKYGYAATIPIANLIPFCSRDKLGRDFEYTWSMEVVMEKLV